jgi:hypothetical protein
MRYSRAGYLGCAITGTALFVLGEAAVIFGLPAGISWAKAGLVSAILIVAIGLALRSFRHADEVMLQSQKTAWFWGSLLSTTVLAPVMIVVGWGLLRLPAWLPLHHMTPQSTFVEGMTFLLLVQGMGFVALMVRQRLR